MASCLRDSLLSDPLMTKKIIVPLFHRAYPIYIGKDALRHLDTLIHKSKIGTDAILITTANIKKLHAAKIVRQLVKVGIRSMILTIPDSEKSKNAQLALGLIEKITRFDVHRNVFLIALGGGVVGDLSGFIAAIYKRGIPYIQIPTTLLAQIDSAIGGKTAVDTSAAKNLVGAFYQPRFVICDISLLKSLPREQIRVGLAEAVKYAMIKDSRLFSFLEKNTRRIMAGEPRVLSTLIERCVSIKAEVVAKDEYDKKGLRAILNFGHTIGHALESASRFKISHGPAVAIGMVYACKLANRLQLMKNKDSLRLVSLLQKIGLPVEIRHIRISELLKAMAHDKKFNRGGNRFVLAIRIGKTRIVENIPLALIKKILTEKTS